MNDHPPESTVEPMLRWFAFDHLPPMLARVSMPFSRLAQELCNVLPRSAERTVALRKLLESKDAAVRCAVADIQETP